MKEKILDIDTAHYLENSTFQIKTAVKLIKQKKLNKSIDKLLDIGCGDGRIVKYFLDKNQNIEALGIDPSKNMIDHAKSIFNSNQNIDFICTKAEEFKIPKRTYCLITAFNSFHWMKDPLLVLENIVCGLKPGGKALILTYPKESPYWKVFEEVLNYKKWHLYLPKSICNSWVTSSQYKDKLEKINKDQKFIYSLQTSENTAFYSSQEEFKNYIKGWISCMVNLSYEDQKSFLSDVCTAIKKSGNNIEQPYLECILYIQAK